MSGNSDLGHAPGFRPWAQARADHAFQLADRWLCHGVSRRLPPTPCVHARWCSGEDDSTGSAHSLPDHLVSLLTVAGGSWQPRLVCRYRCLGVRSRRAALAWNSVGDIQHGGRKPPMSA